MPEVKFTTYIDKLKHLVGMHYLLIPARVVKKLGGKFSMRLLCTVNGKLTFQAGLVALGDGDAYISINAKRMKEIGVKTGDEVKVALKEDKSEYGMEVPAELNELLKQDDEGMRRFKMLSPGKQRYIIHYVSTVKSSNKRLERAVLLITNLKRAPEGKETFRQMLGME
ncbi:MAG: DUF1905 domain-containing protein [Bacteroidia bacterium]